MRLTFQPRLLALLPLALTLPSCQHPSTASSIARIERPTLPTRSAELTATERLAPIGHPETGVLIEVDQGWLDAVVNRLAEAVAAVTRGNNRAAGNKRQDTCVRAVFATGAAPANCSHP